jgi:hypothetical protein
VVGRWRVRASEHGPGICSTPRLLFFFVALMLVSLMWQLVNEDLYGNSNPRVALDCDNPGFGRGLASMVFMRFFNDSHFMFIYWRIGVSFDDLETLTLAVGIMPSFESIASCVSFCIVAAQVPPIVILFLFILKFIAAALDTTLSFVLSVAERSGERAQHE